jgi:hypothetical protein
MRGARAGRSWAAQPGSAVIRGRGAAGLSCDPGSRRSRAQLSSGAAAQPGSAAIRVTGQVRGGTGVYAGTLQLSHGNRADMKRGSLGYTLTCQ